MVTALRTNSIVFCFLLGIRSSLWKHFISSVWILLSLSAHASQPYSKKKATRDLHSLNLISKLIVLLFHSLFIFTIAGVAAVMLWRMFATRLAFFESVAPNGFFFSLSESVDQPFDLARASIEFMSKVKAAWRSSSSPVQHLQRIIRDSWQLSPTYPLTPSEVVFTPAPGRQDLGPKFT